MGTDGGQAQRDRPVAARESARRASAGFHRGWGDERNGRNGERRAVMEGPDGDWRTVSATAAAAAGLVAGGWHDRCASGCKSGGVVVCWSAVDRRSGACGRSSLSVGRLHGGRGSLTVLSLTVLCVRLLLPLFPNGCRVRRPSWTGCDCHAARDP